MSVETRFSLITIAAIVLVYVATYIGGESPAAATNGVLHAAVPLPTHTPTATPSPTVTPFPTPIPDPNAFHWEITDPCGRVYSATGIRPSIPLNLAGDWRIRLIVTYAHEGEDGLPYLAGKEQIVHVNPKSPGELWSSRFEWGDHRDWVPCPTPTPTPTPAVKKARVV